MDAGSVAIPIGWVLGIISALGSVIAVMAREFFKVQNERVAEARGDTEKVVLALNENTNALNALTATLVSGSS